MPRSGRLSIMDRVRRPAFLVSIGVATLLAIGPGTGSSVRPGENGKIAFASARDGNYEVYSVNPDSTALARLTNEGSTDTDPAWSGDGTRIAFTSRRDGNDEIYVMGADGSSPTRLTTSPGDDQNATWSPGGRDLAFLSTRDGDSEILVMNEDGTGQRQLTTNDVVDATPAWSPDGTRIAFRSERDGDSEIYVMAVDGSNAVRLTTSPGADVSPTWSPDGTRIAFASARDGNYEIYVMNADGGSQTRLTRNLETDLDPAWSPNGRSIAFTTNRDANNEIYVMSSDGSGQTRLTAHQAEDTTPDWQWQSEVLPPPKPVTGASFRVRWKESQSLGTLVVRGHVPGLSRLQLALRRGPRIFVASGLNLQAGAFTRSLRLPRNIPPGAFVLDVTANGSPTPLTRQEVPVRLAPPPEGVVSQTWASTTVGGPPLQRVPAANAIVWAHFRFSALPRPGRVLLATWYVDGRRGGEPRVKPHRSLVIAWAQQDPLPRGKYTCVLTAGKTVVKRLSVRVS